MNNTNNDLPSSSDYPQFVSAAGCCDKNDKRTSVTLKNFKRSDGAVHNCLKNVVSYKKTQCGIILESETKARKNIFVYTHATSFFQFNDTEPTIKKISTAIDIFDENIFRVRYFNNDFKDTFKGILDEAKMLVGKPKNCIFTVLEDDEKIEIKTAKMTVSVNKSNSGITAFDSCGKRFFSQNKYEFFMADIFNTSISEQRGEQACFEALTLGYDEEIFGLGERFDSVSRKGRPVDFDNKDAVGTTSPRTYVNIPFYISTNNYGLFLNSGAPTEWEIGTLDSTSLGFGVLDGQLDYFVISGKPKEIIKGYCYLTGFSKLPPLWSFGLWMSRNSYTSWEIVDEIAKSTRANDIPCDVIHLDTAWFTEDWNCDLEFSEERFANPRNKIAKYKEMGFNISLWQYNFIPPKENNKHYRQAVEHGYLAKDEQGNPWQLPKDTPGSWVDDVVVDFSNNEAREWYEKKIETLIEMGAGAIKTDFGEGVPGDAYYKNIEGKYFHNLYSLLYNYTVAKATKKASGEDIVWARSGTAGNQRFPLHWGGDSQCTFEGLAGTLRAALSIGISGIPFFSHDIGGFIGMPTDELYIRWAQFGLFSSHSRCHGSGNETHREPWYFSKEACDIFRYYAKLRYSLMPYIISESEKCVEDGLPMIRALFLEYPDDRNTYFIDHEYMFGDGMLIAPVLKPLAESAERELYLPKGVWYDYFTKEEIHSVGMWITREIDIKTMPIYIKKGTVLNYCNEQTSLINGFGEIVKTEKWDYSRLT